MAARSEFDMASGYTSPAESKADSIERKKLVVWNYGGGCTTGMGGDRGIEARWAGCAQRANPLLSFLAIVASNAGDFGQGRARCSNTGASRSHLSENLSLRLDYMPLAQVACSLAKRNLRVNSEEWQAIALSS